MNEKIGVLLVHGIGEQKHFEHMEAEVRHLALALRGRPSVRSVAVQPNFSLDGARHAEEMTYRADREASLSIFVQHKDETQQVIEFRGVWWADLDERSTFLSRLRFWGWALSQWAVAGAEQNTRGLTDFDKLQFPTSPVRDGPWPWIHWVRVRLQLYLVGAIFLLILTTWTLARNVVQRLLRGSIPPPGILANYVGDVKLILQSARHTEGSLADLGQPPRVSIRRRMIRGLVDMALSSYDRWYILAHSLGTVVAQNGLMETEVCLPNYLDQNTWQRCQDQNLSTALAESAARKTMMPTRPPWLHANDAIDRKRLFSRFQGLLTYGSPLDKFAALWPAIVGINPDPVFQAGTEWINIYHETDPVAGKLDGFGSPPAPGGDHTLISPLNFAYKASPLLLISHLRYLQYTPRSQGSLAEKLAVWLTRENGRPTFPAPVQTDRHWQLDENLRRARRLFRLIQWLALAIGLGCILGYIYLQLCKHGLTCEDVVISLAGFGPDQLQALSLGLEAIAWCLAVTFVVGILHIAGTRAKWL